jgi:hypothetical protein
MEKRFVYAPHENNNKNGLTSTRRNIFMHGRPETQKSETRKGLAETTGICRCKEMSYKGGLNSKRVALR